MRFDKAVPTGVGTVLVLAAIVVTPSCGPDMPVYSHFEQVAPQSWAPEDMRIFEPWPADSASVNHDRYEVRLCLRHKIPSPATATLIVEQESLSTPERRDTVTLHLLDDSGAPTGRGSHGLYTTEVTLDPALRLTAGYSIAVYPLDTIYQTTDIGIVLLRF